MKGTPGTGAGRDIQVQVTISVTPTPYPYSRGIGIRARYKGRLKWWTASLVAAVVLVAAGRPDDSKGEKEGEKAGEERVYALSDGVTPPRVTKQVYPQYPSGSRGVGVEGSILIETVVSSQGTPKNTRVVRGLDKDIDAAAVDAVKQWLFAPGKKDGKPVAVRVQIELRFHSM